MGVQRSTYITHTQSAGRESCSSLPRLVSNNASQAALDTRGGRSLGCEEHLLLQIPLTSLFIFYFIFSNPLPLLPLKFGVLAAQRYTPLNHACSVRCVKVSACKMRHGLHWYNMHLHTPALYVYSVGCLSISVGRQNRVIPEIARVAFYLPSASLVGR